TDAPGAGQAEEVVVKDPPAATESRKRGRDGTDVNAPPKLLRKDHANPRPTGSSHGGKSLAAIQLGGPDSENVSSPVEVGSPKSIYRPEWGVANGGNRVTAAPEVRTRGKAAEEVRCSSGSQGQRIQARELEIKNLEALLETEADMKKVVKDRSAGLIQELEDMRACHRRTRVGYRTRVAPCRDEVRRIPRDEAGVCRCMSEGLRHGVEHGQAQLNVEAIEAYDSEAKAKFVAALQALKDLKYPLVDQLEGLKDAPMDVIMAACT
nr:hypothetical protein [Tanacetum cinerariifolium]